MMNVTDEKDVGHPEYDPDVSRPLFVLASCPVESRPEGAPRLWGNLKIKISTESMAYRIYGREEISEAFTCNFELNAEYREILEDSGARICISTARLGEEMLQTRDPQLKMVWVERGIV